MGNWAVDNTGKPDQSDNARASIDLIAGRIDNVEVGLDGTDALTAVDINGGAIDGTDIGTTTPDTGKFTQVDVDNININGNDITSTNTNGDINITPDGTGSVVASKVDIASGEIDGTPIGANTASTGAFTTISTDGKEALKMDIIVGTVSVSNLSTAPIAVAHGKGTNIRGACVAGYGSTVGSVYSVTIDNATGAGTNKGIDETNVNISVNNYSGTGTSTISYSVVIFYV